MRIHVVSLPHDWQDRTKVLALPFNEDNADLHTQAELPALSSMTWEQQLRQQTLRLPIGYTTGYHPAHESDTSQPWMGHLCNGPLGTGQRPGRAHYAHKV